MNIRSANESDRERWNQCVFSSPPGSFLQSWAWGDFQQRLGIVYWRLIMENHDGTQGVALVVQRPLPLGRSWLYVPRGPHFVSSASKVLQDRPVVLATIWPLLQRALVELARTTHAAFITIDPPWQETDEFFRSSFSAGKWRTSLREIQPRHTLVLDITQADEQLLRTMHEKTRYNIRLAARKGVTVRFSTDVRDLEHFLQLAREVERRSPFRYHPDDYFRAMMQTLVPHGMLELGLAEYCGSVLAANIFITAGGTATYVHGASGLAQRTVMAPHLLMWEAICRARGRDVRLFDFFGVAPPDAHDRHPWAGITRFKEGFGGRRVSYIGAYDLVLDRMGYLAYNVARNVRGMLRS